MLFHNNLKTKTIGHSSCYFKLGAIFSKLNSSQNHYHTSFDETDTSTDYVEILTTAAKNARSKFFLHHHILFIVSFYTIFISFINPMNRMWSFSGQRI